MRPIAMVVPVMKNFKGFTELMQSVNFPVVPYVIDNWTENRGVAAAWNIGIDRAIADGHTDIMVVNDDVTFREDTIKNLLIGLEFYPFVTAVDANPSGNHSQDHNFACFMLESHVIETVGWFDETFKPAYFEDNDYAYRLKLAGHGRLAIDTAVIDHKGSVTQNWEGQQTCSPVRFHINGLYYQGKWGGTPGQETFTSPFNDKSKTIKDW